MFGRFLDILSDIIFPASKERALVEKMGLYEALAMLPKDKNRPRGVFSIFEYRNNLVRTMVWELKYRGNKKVALLCAKILREIILNEHSDSVVFDNRPILLVPIPISGARRLERGFNQNEIVISEIILLDDVGVFEKCFDCLVKVRDTVPQSSLHNRAERLKNLSGCFDVIDLEKVRGRNVVLIDDVVTTGTTLKEARATLLCAGARTIFLITLAH